MACALLIVDNMYEQWGFESVLALEVVLAREMKVSQGEGFSRNRFVCVRQRAWRPVYKAFRMHWTKEVRGCRPVRELALNTCYRIIALTSATHRIMKHVSVKCFIGSSWCDNVIRPGDSWWEISAKVLGTADLIVCNACSNNLMIASL